MSDSLSSGDNVKPTDDFSLKWFGIPDKQVVEFWKKLEQHCPPAEHTYHHWCACMECRRKRNWY